MCRKGIDVAEASLNAQTQMIGQLMDKEDKEKLEHCTKSFLESTNQFKNSKITYKDYKSRMKEAIDEIFDLFDNMYA